MTITYQNLWPLASDPILYKYDNVTLKVTTLSYLANYNIYKLSEVVTRHQSKSSSEHIQTIMITVSIAAELLEEYTVALARITATLLPPLHTSPRRRVRAPTSSGRADSPLPRNDISPSSCAPNYAAFLLNF
ncbi:unnamed protein product [Microthlaspi erraticum]|uniref:Uncharacterized protein n=1 Tax=Microthlaspi erraticum TaxID=1685480 RepID=A0A6D2I1E1_9BRAS|nr:unnamed protein product [Microthlaspi erraticum]CAA7023297.1 unnamed protein product [Microthlaspi erraticum]CAA7023298.1 unnamed protein product [Microthlaspi erraticum]